VNGRDRIWWQVQVWLDSWAFIAFCWLEAVWERAQDTVLAARRASRDSLGPPETFHTPPRPSPSGRVDVAPIPGSGPIGTSGLIAWGVFWLGLWLMFWLGRLP